MSADPATLWHKTAPPMGQHPSLAGPVDCDLLVVGGGFSGLSTALHSAQRGLRVVVLEAERIGFGASGRNAGFVVPNFAKVDPDDVRARLGLEAGNRLVAMAAGSADLVFSLIRDHGIDCDADQAGWMQPSHSAGALAKAKERVRQWSELGRPVELLDRSAIRAMTGIEDWQGGWIDRSGGTINPVGYVRGLARAAIATGVSVHENSPVLSLEPVGSDWRARTQGGNVMARRVVLATNAHAGTMWPGLARSFFPLRVHQIATRPLPATVRQRLLPAGGCVSDSRRNLFTFRFDRDNRLITGGMDIIAFGAGRRVPQAIHRRLAEKTGLTDLPEIEFAWTGMAAVSPDFLPRLVELAPGLIAGFACNGRGIAMTTAMGAELAKWATGEKPAVPLVPLTTIPFHALSRLAPNALLPVSMLRDRLEANS